MLYGRFLKSETSSTMSHEPSRWKHVVIHRCRPGCMLYSTSISLQSRSRKGRNKREQEVPLFPEAYDGTALERYNNIPNAAFSATSLRNSPSLSLSPPPPLSLSPPRLVRIRRRLAREGATYSPPAGRMRQGLGAQSSSHETESTKKKTSLPKTVFLVFHVFV